MPAMMPVVMPAIIFAMMVEMMPAMISAMVVDMMDTVIVQMMPVMMHAMMDTVMVQTIVQMTPAMIFSMMVEMIDMVIVQMMVQMMTAMMAMLMVQTIVQMMPAMMAMMMVLIHRRSFSLLDFFNSFTASKSRKHQKQSNKNTQPYVGFSHFRTDKYAKSVYGAHKLITNRFIHLISMLVNTFMEKSYPETTSDRIESSFAKINL